MVPWSRFVAGRLFASALLIASATTCWAGPVSPSDVKIVDGAVKTSLSGQRGDAGKGRLLYFNRKLGNCLACHANKDVADQPFHGEIGPPLDGVADRYSEQELRAILVDSKVALGEQTIMPAFYKTPTGQRTRKEFQNKTILTAEQVEDIIAYLLTLKE